MTATSLPTDAEVAAAQALLTRSATAKADTAKAALITLVTMPEYNKVATLPAKPSLSAPATSTWAMSCR